jgi:hypothetical protein
MALRVMKAWVPATSRSSSQPTKPEIRDKPMIPANAKNKRPPMPSLPGTLVTPMPTSPGALSCAPIRPPV